jgi:hypothetical protein
MLLVFWRGLPAQATYTQVRSNENEDNHLKREVDIAHDSEE